MVQFGFCEEIKAEIMQTCYWFDGICEETKAEIAQT